MLSQRLPVKLDEWHILLDLFAAAFHVAGAPGILGGFAHGEQDGGEEVDLAQLQEMGDLFQPARVEAVVFTIALEEDRHEAPGEARNIVPAPASDVEEHHGDVVDEMPVDAVIEVEERHGVVLVHEQVAGVGILVDHAIAVPVMRQRAQVVKKGLVFIPDALFPCRELAVGGIVFWVVPGVTPPGRVGGDIRFGQGVHAPEQAAVIEEQAFVDVCFPGDAAARLDEGRAEELPAVAVCDGLNQAAVSREDRPGDGRPAVGQVIDPVHLAADVVRGAAGAVPDAQDVVPIRAVELVDEALEAVEQGDLAGGDIVALYGSLQDVVVEKGGDLGVHDPIIILVKLYLCRKESSPYWRSLFPGYKRRNVYRASMKSNSPLPSIAGRLGLLIFVVLSNYTPLLSREIDPYARIGVTVSLLVR